MGGNGQSRITPIQWMHDHGKGVFVQPFVNNFAGWTKSQLQFHSYLLDGTFDKAHLLTAELCVYESWGDPS